MRQSILLAFIFISSFASAQTHFKDGTAMLAAVSKKLSALKTVGYSYVREMKYVSDNYDSKDSADVYMNFIAQSPVGVRFQARQAAGLFIFDGNVALDLDGTAMTIDSATRSPRMMESNSFLYSSIASLRNNLPLVLAKDSIYKILSDTVVDGRQLFCIRFEGPNMYLQGFKGIAYHDEPLLKRPNYLLVDKKSLMPYQFVQKLVKGEDDRDYIRVTFRSLKANAAAPANSSWLYATYRDSYKPYVDKETVPLVRSGATIPAFKYPVFDGTGNDSLSSETLQGKVVLIEFWFKSCGPCLKAMPHYNALQQKFSGSSFQLLTINIEDPVKDIDFFYKKYPPVYPMLYDGRPLFDSLGFTGCPSSVLVGRDGKVIRTFFGFDEELIQKSISALL